MKIWRLAASLIAVLALFSSCGGNSDDVLPEITIMQDEVRFESAGGSQTITLKANAAWSFSKGVDWIQADPISGGATPSGTTITFVAKMNTGYER